ncbi:MAG: cofactor-independent phosphoglycerate mutase [Bacteroidetes bacterium]|nr:cofactor-independent phosphoglycerate mutase [Bacteroidota bacterium]MBT7828181.1 cofactor-independent phosphoglycerate mutase [Bacteroidota bacterium]
MKYIIILGDGMADYPMERLGNKTPLQAANIPNIDKLAKMGRTGRLITVPADMPPGSEIANMAVLGYDVKKVYQGRGVLEAASMGVELDETDLAMRCNIICIENGIIKNHSAGHISNEEAYELLVALKKELDSDIITFHPGVSYRHLLVVKNGVNDFSCTPPHDVPGTPSLDVMVKANNSASATGDLLNELILKSQEILSKHPINLKRIAEGKDPANSIWPWSPGNKPEMKTLKELYGKTGAVISAVDLLYGIGAYAGMKAIKVPGSTGLYDTNYEGKAETALKALEEVDLVYLHIEASDEAGHEGNAELKTKTIEYLDNRVVKFLMEETAKMEEDVALAVIPDHPTPCDLRTHTHDSVPFIIYHPGVEGDSVKEYNEESVKKGFYGELKGDEFIKALFSK